MTKTSGTFIDREAQSPAYWSVRNVDGVIALGLGVESNGDIDIGMDAATARALATALLVMAAED
jgi:hypothetical protein